MEPELQGEQQYRVRSVNWEEEVGKPEKVQRKGSIYILAKYQSRTEG